jgi:predicted RNA-binding Zn ribbon-like protein
MSQANSADYSIDRIRFSGGRPCLDFVNTIHDRYAEAPLDYLATPRQYLQWCLRAHLLTPQEADRIRVSTGVMGEVRAFRQHLHVLLSARIDGTEVHSITLRECDRWLHQAWADLALDPGSPQGVSWSSTAPDARRPLKRIALSALDVLKTAQPQRLKRCASPDSCGWLFYDDSKGGQRRWCAMETCGSLEKMRRYRRAGPTNGSAADVH